MKNFKLSKEDESCDCKEDIQQDWNELQMQVSKVQFRLDGVINNPQHYRNILDRIEMLTENDEVVVTVDSVGGDLDGCIALCDVLQATEATVTGIMINRAYSAGSYIALCCDNLEVRPNARMMLHSYRAYGRNPVGFIHFFLKEINIMSERKMATIRKISAIESIPEADKICVYLIDGWKVVDSIGKYQVDDLVVFCEIDSFIPNSIAPFLTAPDRFPKEYLGVQGERLRTKRLRKVISQGLILPLYVIKNKIFSLEVNSDVSELLGIVKYEPPIPAQLAGQIKGNFPSLVPRTDQNRIQNIKLEEYYGEYEVTEKLEGSSMTCLLDQEGNFEVCSRNLSLKEDPNNSFWKAALAYGIREKMLELNLQGYALQGELIGEGIQGNIYCIKGVDFYVYDIYCTKKAEYLPSAERITISTMLGLKHVPVVDMHFVIDASTTKDNLLQMAEDFSKLNPKQQQEGFVLKNINDPSNSFKIVSNRYLTGSKL